MIGISWRGLLLDEKSQWTNLIIIILQLLRHKYFLLPHQWYWIFLSEVFWVNIRTGRQRTYAHACYSQIACMCWGFTWFAVSGIQERVEYTSEFPDHLLFFVRYQKLYSLSLFRKNLCSYLCHNFHCVSYLPPPPPPLTTPQCLHFASSIIILYTNP